MSAQTPADPGKSDDVTVLSPFEVRTNRDQGFVASSSLAGGRLAGDLKDTPVAYSVLTKDFIEALDLKDLNELARWAPNSYEVPDNGSAFSTGDTTTITSRGLRGNSPQRNFFPITFSFDSYNIERLDLARGPNSVLFGSGTVSGTANSVTKRADTARDFGQIRVSYASWDNLRFTFDYNRPLTKQFALRLNILYNETDGWRDRDYDRRKGMTLASTWKPFSHTEIRLEGELGWRRKATVVTNFDDFLSAWDGKTTYNSRIAAAVPAAGITVTGARYPVFTPSLSANTLVNYQGWPITQGGNTTSAYPAGGVLVVGPSANISNNPIIDQVNLPSSLYQLAVNGSHFRVPSRTFAVTYDDAAYGLQHQNYTLSLTQSVGDRLFAEVAGYVGREDVTNDFAVTRGLSQVFLDVNSTLPTGAPNPNFLQPYAETRSWPYHQVRRLMSGRFALGYVLDHTRWGDFHFNMLGGYNRDDFERNAYNYVLTTNADPRAWPSDMQVRYRYYLNTDTNRALPRPSSWTYVDPITNTTQAVSAKDVRDYTNAGFNIVNRIDTGYGQAAVTAKLFHGRLDLVNAVRRDSYRTHQKSIVAQFDNPTNWDGTTYVAKPNAPPDWTTLTYRLRDATGKQIGPEIPATTRPRIGNLRDPLYASDRFQDDYTSPDSTGTVYKGTYGGVLHVTNRVSAFVNYAQSFVPPAQQVDIHGGQFPPQASEGWDFGLRYVTGDGRVSANLIYYTGKGTNRPLSSTVFGNFNSILNARPVGDLTPGDRNKYGLLPLPPYNDFADVQTKGWELEVTANVTPRWRLVLNGSLPEAYQTNTYPQTLGYLAQNLDTLRKIVTDAGGIIGTNNVATFNPAIPTSQAPDGPAAVAQWNTFQSALASIVRAPQKLTRLTEGLANIYTDYAFRGGLLKGLRAGVGINYRGRQVIGYKGADTIRDPANPNQAIDDPRVGALDPVYMKEYYSGTVTINYSRKLTEKYTLHIDFKVDNLFGYNDPVYYVTVMRPPGGDLTNPARVATPQRFSWLTPRNYTLATSISF